MPTYRFTLFSNMSVMGAAETYYTRGNVGIDTFAEQLQHFLNLRTDLMYANQEVVGVRVADLGTTFPTGVLKRKSVFWPPGSRKLPGSTTVINVRQRGTFGDPTAADHPDQYRVALQEAVIHGGGRQTIRYLTAVPDEATTFDPGALNMAKPPAWWAKYNDYATYRRQTFSLLARVPHPVEVEAQVLALQLATAGPAEIGMTVAQPPAPLFAVGDKISVKGFRFKFGGRKTLNGIWRVSAVVGTSSSPLLVVFLRGSAGIDINEIKTFGTIQRVAFQLDNIERIDPLRAGIHKRGRPSPAPRGRRLTRILLDP